MADNGKNCGYVGSVPNSGAAVVQAPNQVKVTKNVTVQKGKDLRSGK